MTPQHWGVKQRHAELLSSKGAFHMAVQSIDNLYRYDLSDDEITLRSQQLASRYSSFLRPLADSGVSFACVAVDGRDPLADVGRSLEQRVFDDEAGDHTIEVMHSEYGSYEDRSVFFLGYDIREGQISGCLRAITGTAGFGPMVKTMRDCLYIDSYRDLGAPRPPEEIDLRDDSGTLDPEVGLLGGHRNPPGHRLDRNFLESYHLMQPGEGIFDMATVVVSSAAREGAEERLSLLLYACSWRGALRLGMPHAVTFIRQDLLEVFRSHLGMAWEDLAGLGGTQYVEGDPFLSQPAYAHLDGFRHMFQRELIKGDLGLERKTPPPFDHFADLMVNPSAAGFFLLD